MPLWNPDDLQRSTVIPDLYPRRDDPFRPGGLPPPSDSIGNLPGPAIGPGSSISAYITTPTQRPVVYQTAVNFVISLTAANSAVPLTNVSLQCESIILDVFNAVGTSAFWGYGSGITPLNGIELRPGLPIIISTENTREMWELQRSIEAMASIMCLERGITPVSPYKSPRVVFDASDYWLVAATVPINVSVMLFPTPILQ